MKKAKADKKQKLSPKATKVEDIERFVCADHTDPFAVLGMHPLEDGSAWVIRVWRPGAQQVSVLRLEAGGEELVMTKVHPAGFFELLLPDAKEKFAYQLKWKTVDGHEVDPVGDVYAFGTILGEQDLHYLGEGKHRQLYEVFGAHCREMDGVSGMSFVVWAPNARRVSVVGDFNGWDGRVHVMRRRAEAGVWELFVPGVSAGAHYKFELVGADGSLFNKSDPFAFFSQHGPETASITYDLKRYQWDDAAWMKQRAETDYYSRPVSVYEVHLGSWARVPEEGDRFLTYHELADRLVKHVVELGFTHIELMPVAEFPFDGSWGYQICGFFAPTSRFGAPDDFRYFVDRCHQAGIGVILDWVPAHFPKDAHGLAKFDGTALYEHEDPRQGEHMDWGTLIFNFGRDEVRNFLISNAMFWLDQYHIDGLRVDAVASMLYLDYSREEGQWMPNVHGGRENLEAISFLKELNGACYGAFPGIMTIAEESTAFAGVSRPVDQGGLGFGFKWNMGWMHDYLQYMEREPVHRKHHHGEATFSMIYAYDENFFLVLSHDEVVHGKKSLLEKMPGDRWQQFANLRLFYAWMYAHPGKKLLFQGSEIAPPTEWNYNQSLDWHLLEHKEHAGVRNLVADLNRLYQDEAALYEIDHDARGFEWIDHEDAENSGFSFVRRSSEGEEIVVVVNATPVPRVDFRVGVPGEGGFYKEVLNSDAERYGGSNLGSGGGVKSEAVACNGHAHSIVLKLPPLAVVYFRKN
ncbi:MAG: 1,4-alpha-glucan branching protein GlgB [Verrucomicrobiales bacterium]|nr:1,4-alpha-glucan branching protein GlgB [Verrucomicrobiales bacterium]